MRLVKAVFLGLAFAGVASFVEAAPLPAASVPTPLKPWVPWVMQGHEMLACPAPYNRERDAEAARSCDWPSHLELQVSAAGAQFRFEVQVYGASALIELPGEPGRWPEDAKVDGKSLAVATRDGRPIAELLPGSHLVTGTLRWTEMPEDLLLPRATGSLRVTLNGKALERTPDAEGRILLEQTEREAQTSDAVTVRVSRLVDDDIPLRVTTHFDIAISGKPREIQLPAALLPGFVAETLDSALPARLQEQGLLRVQGRPGNWTVDVVGRLTQPIAALPLPAGQTDEVWSFNAHNELRIVSVEGLTSVDPKQVPIPEGWRVYPAYQVKAGQTMKLVESRRGNPQPAADRLTLARQIWLDFDGRGYTLQDAINGTLSRSWRLEVAPGEALGRASANGVDQPITRRAGAAADGVELRHGNMTLVADSRLEGSQRTLPATGWAADFAAASAQLNLPPGWQLLHAGGVDRAEGSWLASWTLWDFFFILLSVLGAAKLFGRWAAALLGGALILTWHVDGAPHFPWLLLLALVALQRVVPTARFRVGTARVAKLCLLVIALWLVPFAVEQIRFSIYPSLEHSWQQASGNAATATGSQFDRKNLNLNRLNSSSVAAPAPVMQSRDEPTEAKSESLADKSADALKEQERPRLMSPKGAAVAGKVSNAQALNEIDPRVKVQTGPGLPAWEWNSHHLQWQGPVQGAQEIVLYLLPPAATVVLRLGGLALLIASLWALGGRALGWPRWRGPAACAGTPSTATAASLAMTIVLFAALAASSGESQAAPAPDATTQTDAGPAAGSPPSDVLDELRRKLTAPPDCLPNCADVARMRIEAKGSRVQLRLDVHALADVTLPLPGQGVNWRPSSITSADGKPLAVRRDADGALWMAARAGVTQVLIAADVGDATNVEIALPLPPRELSVGAEGWAVSGLDARGQASGALTLARSASSGAASSSGTQRDALPPFVRVERTLHIGLLWTIETQIVRAAPSRAPVRVKVRLLDGESVTNEVVRVEDGYATVQLGAEDSTSFVSTLKEAGQLRLVAANEASQVETWRLDPSTQWHFEWSGIAPVRYTDGVGGDLAPSWQPWPNESIVLAISKPAGAAGQTLTVDRLHISVAPGLRATEVSTTATLRASQGSNHKLQLPPGAEFLGLSLDGQAQAIQPQKTGELLIPVTPGEHALKVDWREPHGLGWFFATTPFSLGAAGVNASTEIRLPAERVVLFVGGPRIGPAVLFWGVVSVLLLVAIALGRSRLTPLGAGAWFLLGLGLAQSSLLGAAVVGGWFFALAARSRYGLPGRDDDRRGARLAANLLQLLLLLWTLVAAAFLFNAVRVGLLGYPDLMIDGNGSGPRLLNWYQDRFAEQPRTAWVISAPVLVYRLLMLGWALWLAASVLKWIRWAWDAYGADGYWRRKPSPSKATTPVPEAHEAPSDVIAPLPEA